MQAQFGWWPDRAGDEVPPAVRAAAMKTVLNTLPAKGAFEATDHRFRRVRRQVSITAFTVGPEFEHRHFHSDERRVRYEV
jgi:hypothetical protein